MLAVKVVQEQGISVQGITFETPFFNARKAQASAQHLRMPLRVIDITDEHLEMLKAPRYGYGKNMNPCIDCHTLMLHVAGRMMEEYGADFLFTGEVLGQRPMSQTRQSLHMVAKNSGYGELIVRPLSARLLPESVPEREGKVDRALLLDIQGRSRRRQMELAEKFGLHRFPPPAGGCLLTDPMFSVRLRDLFSHHPEHDRRDLELLKYGRHFRISPTARVIVGRNEKDNSALQTLIRAGDTVLRMASVPGPLVLIPGGGTEAETATAARLCVLYSDAVKGEAADILIVKGNESRRGSFAAADREEARAWIIQQTRASQR
ncbi:MAG: tRNA 4-thiouridine(8) synthase ThiI [Syntrophobacterales bacterium]|jgi:tRNA U34 2-thiouridine synthase MnmA/TrmU|nr:tRNA 4-thiouridine(8) synthase ThiI [Syntrophobacterales bacterium]